MPDIIGVGESDIDIFLKADHPPGKGEKVRAEEIGKLPGGIIGNFCSGVVKHGVSCGIVSVLGDDENGKIALDDYKDRGIDITGLTIKKGGKTFYCVVHIDDSGEKYLTAVPTPLISPALEDIDESYLKQAQYVHMSSMDYGLTDYVSLMLEGSKTKVSLDYEAHAEKGKFEFWEKILRRVSILFINEDGLKSLMFGLEQDEAAKTLLRLGIECIVITCAEKGGFVYLQDQSYRYRAFKAEKVVDTTGAGDCFNAAFLSATVKKMPIVARMRYAAAASALAIQKLGARTGLPTSKEIEAFLSTNPDTLA